MRALLALGMVVSSVSFAQAPPCNTCHGDKGQGNPQMNAPRIAGQSEGYLLRQLEAYANGQRDHPVMGPIAKQMSQDQRAAEARQWSSTEAPGMKATGAAPAAGNQLATVGDAQRRLQACANCHGPEGVGSPPDVPYLAGQQQAYLVGSLQQWKSGARKSDPSGQMNNVGQRLSDDEMKAVAQYYASLRSPAPGMLVAKGPSRPGPAGRSSGPGDTGAVQGIGVEQGSPTTGGSQGPGGGGGASGTGSQGSK